MLVRAVPVAGQSSSWIAPWLSVTLSRTPFGCAYLLDSTVPARVLLPLCGHLGAGKSLPPHMLLSPVANVPGAVQRKALPDSVSR